METKLIDCDRAMVIHIICAARPNFMKVAPLYHALVKERWAKSVIVHTGQHYDLNMSDAFFKDLALPKPDISLGVGSGTHAEQTGRVMMSYEKILYDHRPDLVVVVGDVNSTMAATLAATKIVYPGNSFNHITYQRKRPLVAHLEAGLRSFDQTMPEEINRLVTDRLADIHWVPSDDAVENLLREGIAREKIELVGNIMIDSLEMLREKIENQQTYAMFGLEQKEYAVATFHRPANVDDPAVLENLCKTVKSIAEKLPVVFPVHPRTMKKLEENNLVGLLVSSDRVLLLEPLNYIRFMNLVINSRFIVTDSGGVQEETSYLGIPCLTVRENTERPVTLTLGTNQLCSLDELVEKSNAILDGFVRKPKEIPLWDGRTAERIVTSLRNVNNGVGKALAA